MRPLDPADFIGVRFGRLTICDLLPPGLGRPRKAVAQCNCGKIKTYALKNIRRGLSRSCGGCGERPSGFRHGHSVGRKQTSEHKIWSQIKGRCLNSNNRGYANYGGRGIKVCDRWLVFENFYSDMGPRPSLKHSIDRINNDGDYEPNNCRWATAKEQAFNRRQNRLVTAFGKTKPLGLWAEEVGIHRSCIFSRLNMGWPPELALSTPSNKSKRRSNQ